MGNETEYGWMRIHEAVPTHPRNRNSDREITRNFDFKPKHFSNSEFDAFQDSMFCSIEDKLLELNIAVCAFTRPFQPTKEMDDNDWSIMQNFDFQCQQLRASDFSETVFAVPCDPMNGISFFWVGWAEIANTHLTHPSNRHCELPMMRNIDSPHQVYPPPHFFWSGICSFLWSN